MAGWFEENVIAPVKKKKDEAVDRVSAYAGDLVEDPGRAALALITGGGSEGMRETGVALQTGIEDEAARAADRERLAAGSHPGLPAALATPTAASASDEPIKDTLEEQRRSRGRASTILTSRRGLTSESTTARRTLLGV